MKSENLYLDKKGMEEYYQEIARLKEELNQVRALRNGVYDKASIHNSVEIDTLNSQERIIIDQISRRYLNLQRIILVEKHTDDECIDIGDVLLIDMVLDDNNPEEMTIELVTGETVEDDEREVTPVSINSPLGAVLYQRKIGEEVSYVVNNNEIKVLIKSKINLEPLPNSRNR